MDEAYYVNLVELLERYRKIESSTLTEHYETRIRELKDRYAEILTDYYRERDEAIRYRHIAHDLGYSE